MVVAQLEERSLPIPEDRDLNPAQTSILHESSHRQTLIMIIYFYCRKEENKEKRAKMPHFKMMDLHVPSLIAKFALLEISTLSCAVLQHGQH